MKYLIGSTKIVSFLLLLASSANAEVIEDFDSVGTSMEETVFSKVIYGIGSGLFVREPLIAEYRAPDALPPLPINIGGDKELRYFDQLASSSASTSYTLVSSSDGITSDNVIIEAVVGAGVFSSSQASVGLLARTSGDTMLTMNGYKGTFIIRDDGVTGSLALQKVTNGLNGFPCSGVQSFEVDPANENYRLVFAVIDSDLTLAIARVTPMGGTTKERLIANIRCEHTEFTSGMVGVHARTIQNNMVFVDDFRAADCNKIIKPGNIPECVRKRK